MQALTNKTTMTALNEVLHDAVTMGAETSELSEGVRLRLQSAQAWEERAAQVLDAPEKPTDDELRVMLYLFGASNDHLQQAYHNNGEQSCL